MTVEVSVVVPAHNVAPWIADTLWSIQRQREQSIEVIVVDDHSTDATREIVEEAAARDSRIRLITSPRPGAGSARNVGILHARGRFLAFADGDDLVPDGAYKALLASMDESIDIVTGDYITFASRTSWRRSSNLKIYRPRHGITIHDEPKLLRDRVVWNKLFRREYWDGQNIEFPDVRRANDIEPMTRALLNARIAIIRDVTYIYRKRPGGSSMSAAGRQLVGLRDYFNEEARSADLVAQSEDARLAHEYFAFLLAHDVWSHLQHAIALAASATEDAPMAHDVLLSVQSIIDNADSSDWDRLGNDQVWRYQLLSAGRPDLIEILPAVGGARPRLPTVAELDVLCEALGSHIRTVELDVIRRSVRTDVSMGEVARLRELVLRLGDDALQLDKDLHAAILSTNQAAIAAIARRSSGATVEATSVGQVKNAVIVEVPKSHTRIARFTLRNRRNGHERNLRYAASSESFGLAVNERLLRFGLWDLNAVTVVDGTEVSMPVGFASGVFAPPRHTWQSLYVLSAHENRGRITIGKKRPLPIRLANRAAARLQGAVSRTLRKG